MPNHAILIEIGLALEAIHSEKEFEQFLMGLDEVNGLEWKKTANEITLCYEEKTCKINYVNEPFQKETSDYWSMAQEIISEENWKQMLYYNDLDDDKLIQSN